LIISTGKKSSKSKSDFPGREIKKELWAFRFHINKFKDYVIVHKEGILVKESLTMTPKKGQSCVSLSIKIKMHILILN